ncbi:MFS transporter [Streptomyces sp. NBC_00344]|uniref:MFS transporter n=1 Tax=Streptomyces sp. NBC_00344 TaxID=2975720 RepID=UPI002E20C9F0
MTTTDAQAAAATRYGSLFRTPEFTPLFLATVLQATARAVSGLALGSMVYARTGSPLLSALAMFGPSLAQVIGATLLMSAADRLPPRAATSGLALVLAVSTCAQAIPGLPVWAVFAVLLSAGTLTSVGGGVRFGLLNEILSKESYLPGRAVFNMAAGIVQICGFAVGGVLLTAFSPRGTLLVGAVLQLTAAVVGRFGLSRRAPRAAGRPSVAATWGNNRVLWSSSPRRYIYLALWVPNGLIVGCESLFISYRPQQAGLLFAFAALGMLLGDAAVGRFVPAGWRNRLAAPLRLLLAVPYLVLALRPDFPIVVVAVVLASAGYAASLLLQERLLAITPPEMHGHALGLHTSGMLTVQGLGAALAGFVAQHSSPATSMALLAALSVAVTLALSGGLRAGTGPS